MNTYKEIELNNGKKIKITLNLRKLLLLKSNHKDIYDDANKIIIMGSTDVFDLIKVLYASYLCGLEDKNANVLSYDEFLEQLPFGIGEITNVVMDLIYPKKK